MLGALLASALVGLWTGLLWHQWIDRGRALGDARRAGSTVLRHAALAGSGGVVTAILAAPAVWIAARGGYSGDSFFTLAPWARASLAALSAVLSLALFGLSAAKSSVLHRAGAKWRVPLPLRLAADLAASAALMVVAVAVSPQIYYAFYRLIVSGLPAQWQVRGWSAGETLLRQAHLAPDASLADHLVGLTVWSLLIATCWLFVFAHPQIRRQVSSRTAGAGAVVACGLVYGLMRFV